MRPVIPWYPFPARKSSVWPITPELFTLRTSLVRLLEDQLADGLHDLFTRKGLGHLAGPEGELAMHVRAALTNGLTRAEISEAILHTAIYAGVPAANAAFAEPRETFAGLDAAAQHSADDSSTYSRTEFTDTPAAALATGVASDDSDVYTAFRPS